MPRSVSLLWSGIFCRKPSIAEPGSEENDDRPWSSTALDRKPEIFNTDQGSQFTSFAFTNTLKDADIRISMDGRGRWMDNVFIERLWRSLKYECVFLNAFWSGSEARTGIGCWIGYYNADTPLDLRRQDARRGLCYAGKRGEIGGVIEPRIHLSQAAILSRIPGPPLRRVIQT